jgi:putative methyltransferase (TIGR04325 family)
MLEDQINGKVNSWAIRWYASAFIKDKYTLYPATSLIYNIGFDNSGTHSGGVDNFNNQNWSPEVRIKIDTSQRVTTNRRALAKWIKYLKMTHGTSKDTGVKQKLRSIISRIYSKLKQNRIEEANSNLDDNVWEKEYISYEDAQKFSEGYGSSQILDKVFDSLIKVKNGEAVYERDSVLFDELQHNWGLIAILEKVAIENNLKLNLFDFGGSLGSTFFYVSKMIPPHVKLHWSIVEQKHYVDRGKEFFEDERLKFFYTVEECMEKRSPNVLLLSGVIQYVSDLEYMIGHLQSFKFDYIVVDRTPFIEGEKEFWSIQKVPEFIYKAEYPCFIFNEHKFIKRFPGYKVEFIFDSVYDGRKNINGKICTWKGMLLKRINEPGR